MHSGITYVKLGISSSTLCEDLLPCLVAVGLVSFSEVASGRPSSTKDARGTESLSADERHVVWE